MPEDKRPHHTYILPSPNLPDTVFLQFYDENNEQHNDQNVTWSRSRITDDDVAYIRSDLAIERFQEAANECSDLKDRCKHLTDRLLLIENQTQIVAEGMDKERRAIIIDMVIQFRKITGQHETEIKKDAWYFTAGKFNIEVANRLFPDAMAPKTKEINP